ncbi:MAG: regulator [Microcella sp.]|uniref:AAA family ATPase n=1 Tax=Microcella sp. TaxID=1913979 RepID=UPI0024C53123|nr:regulator [Microcella sp.]UYN82528.1 MAG: regulator [Microcella sp.]
MLVALAVPGLDSDVVELAVLRAGHQVAWRASDHDEVLTQMAHVAPQALLLSDHPAVATPTVVGACDLLGVRSCLVVDDRPLSVGAARLELSDVMRLGADGSLDLGALDAPPAPPADSSPGAHPAPPADAPSTDSAPVVADIRPANQPHALDTSTRAGAAHDERHQRFAPPAAARPLIITVWGPTGAPGRTTIAIGIAAELSARGHSVCLIDADTYGGTVAPALGLLDEAPGFAAACRLAGADSLDFTELDRVSQSVGRPGHGEFAVLTGIGRPHRWPELSTPRVEAVLSMCRQWRSIVVVDAGFNLETDEEVSSDIAAPRRNAATIAALRAADRVIAVGAADPLGLARFLRLHADLLDTVETSEVQVVINRVRASVLGIDPHGQVRQTLDRFVRVRDAVLIDDDTDAADAALLTARPVTHAAPRSALALGIAQLADRLVAPAAAARSTRANGWWRRTG